MYLIFDLSSCKDRGILKSVSNVSDGAFLEKIEDDFLVVKNSMLLPHYPRKIKHFKNVIKITPKKKSLSVIEGKIYIDNYL